VTYFHCSTQWSHIILAGISTDRPIIPALSGQYPNGSPWDLPSDTEINNRPKLLDISIERLIIPVPSAQSPKGFPFVTEINEIPSYSTSL